AGGRIAGTAVIGQVSEQFIHARVVGGIMDIAPVLPGLDQTSVSKLFQMKREGGVSQIELLGNFSRDAAVFPGLHQQPEHRQTTLLRKRCQCFEDMPGFHISIIIETWEKVKQWQSAEIKNRVPPPPPWRESCGRPPNLLLRTGGRLQQGSSLSAFGAIAIGAHAL